MSLRKYNGDINKVTIREISSLSDVSVGLINYHFKDKENLIAICVHKLISNVVTSFEPDMSIRKELPPYEAARARLKHAAKQVFDFFFAHKDLTKISILSDYNDYRSDTNSFYAIKGFSYIIGEGIVDKVKKERISFYLANSMQVAFLKSLSTPEFLGYDFTKKKDRDQYIEDIVDNVMGVKK